MLRLRQVLRFVARGSHYVFGIDLFGGRRLFRLSFFANYRLVLGDVAEFNLHEPQRLDQENPLQLRIKRSNQF